MAHEVKTDLEVTGQVKIVDSATLPPLNVAERSTAPSSPASDDIYLDDGSNTVSGDPGWRRWTGAAWEDIGGGSGGGSVATVDAIGDVESMTEATGDILYRTSGGKWDKLAIGTAGYVLKVSAGIPAWVAEGGGTTHALLSATHTDSVVGTVLRGAIVVGNATPAWELLALGTTGKYLRSDGTDAGWAAIQAGDLPAHNQAASTITSGTLLHEQGGLEADVSAYNGLVKISGGVTSAVTITAAGAAILDDATAAAQRGTLGAAVSGLNSDIAALTGLNTQNAVQLGPYGASAGNTGEIRFLELGASGSNYVGFKAPDAIAANIMWVLPSADGSSGQALVTNASGVLSWATFISSVATLDAVGDVESMTEATGDILYRTAGGKWDKLAIGSAGQVLKVVSGLPSWASEAGAAHALLSATHTDAAAAAVARGSIIVGNDTPAWSALVIGTTGKYVRSDGTDVAWAAIADGDLPASITASKISGVASAITGLTGLATQASVVIGPYHTDAGDTGELRFLELAGGGTNYVGFKAPDAIDASVIWTLPAADGSSGQVLSTNGSGVLSWATGGGGGSDYVAKTLFDANTILAATTDDTPAAVTVAEQRFVGRITGGNIAALTGAQALGILGTFTTASVTLYVDKGGNDSNAGTSGAPKLTIGGAIDALPITIAHASYINVGAGTYTESLTTPLSRLNVLASLTIRAVNTSDVALHVTGTASGGDADDIIVEAADITADDQWNDGQIILYGGTGSGQIVDVSDTVDSTSKIIVAAWDTNPAAGTTYILTGLVTIDGNTTSALAANGLRNVNFEGIRFTVSGSDSYNCVDLNAFSYLKFTDCLFDDIYAFSCGISSGAALYYCGIRIPANGYGLTVQTGSFVTAVSGCVVYGAKSGDYGVYIASGGTLNVAALQVRHCATGVRATGGGWELGTYITYTDNTTNTNPDAPATIADLITDGFSFIQDQS